MEIALKIAQLQTLPISELRHLWKHYFGTECEDQKREFYISRIPVYHFVFLSLNGIMNLRNLYDHLKTLL